MQACTENFIIVIFDFALIFIQSLLKRVQIYIIPLYSTLSRYGPVVNIAVDALKLQLVRVRSSGLAEGVLLFLKFIFILPLYISLNH